MFESMLQWARPKANHPARCFLLLIIGCLTSIFMASGAYAANFPNQKITYVLHVSPGGATDVLARLIAKPMSKELGVPIIVQNRPGGGGAVEMNILTHSKPDGYTIGSVTASHIGRFHTTLTQYNVHSISWIARLVVDPFLIVVPENSPFHTLGDLVKYARAHPNQLSVGSYGGVGSASNIVWEMLADKEKITGEWVPYKSVSSAVTAALGNHINAAIAYTDLVKEYVRAHKLRALGVLNKTRVSALPNVPTFAEAGYPIDSNWEQFRGIIAPPGMPADIKKVLADAALKAMKTKTLQNYMRKNDLVDGSMNSAEFTKYAEHRNQVTVMWLKKLNLLK